MSDLDEFTTRQLAAESFILLWLLRASAVQSQSPCTETALARLATGKPEEPEKNIDYGSS